jgi:hypothetical protein
MKQTKNNGAKAKQTITKPTTKVATAKAAVQSASQPSAGCCGITNNCIANRAYSLWEDAGRPQGRDVEFWLQAEHQLHHEARAIAA